MVNHNICLYKEIAKKYTGCNLKTMELLDRAHIWICAVIRSNTVHRFTVNLLRVRKPVFLKPFLSAKTDNSANNEDPVGTALKESSYQDLHCLRFSFDFKLKSLWMSKFKIESVHFRNWGMKDLTKPFWQRIYTKMMMVLCFKYFEHYFSAIGTIWRMIKGSVQWTTIHS